MGINGGGEYHIFCLIVKMNWTLGEASPYKFEEIGDSEENTTHKDEEKDGGDDDDAESCVIGNSDDLDDDENRGCTSWRMWCLLGHNGDWEDEDRRQRNYDDDTTRRSHLPTTVDEAEKNKLFWEACLADESSMTPIF